MNFQSSVQTGGGVTPIYNLGWAGTKGQMELTNVTLAKGYLQMELYLQSVQGGLPRCYPGL